MTRPARKRVVSYDGHRWEVTDDRGKLLLIERGRGAYAQWVYAQLVRG